QAAAGSRRAWRPAGAARLDGIVQAEARGGVHSRPSSPASPRSQASPSPRRRPFRPSLLRPGVLHWPRPATSRPLLREKVVHVRNYFENPNQLGAKYIEVIVVVDVQKAWCVCLLLLFLRGGGSPAAPPCRYGSVQPQDELSGVPSAMMACDSSCRCGLSSCSPPVWITPGALSHPAYKAVLLQGAAQQPED
ncbi:unnamed protein product, partial [Prorocentrum cordatum]